MNTLEEKLNSMPENSGSERDDFDFYTDLQKFVESIQTATDTGSIHCEKQEHELINVREMIYVLRSCEEFIDAGEELLSYNSKYLPDDLNDAIRTVNKLVYDKIKDIYFATELKYGVIRDLYLTFIVAEKATKLYFIAKGYMAEFYIANIKSKE